MSREIAIINNEVGPELGSLLSLRREGQNTLPKSATPYLCIVCRRLFFRNDIPLRAKRKCGDDCSLGQDIDFLTMSKPTINRQTLIDIRR